MRAAVGFPVLCSPMRLQILVKFFRGLFQVMNRLIKVGVGFQGENDEISRLQWLDDEVQILVAAADSRWCITEELVNSLQMV